MTFLKEIRQDRKIGLREAARRAEMSPTTYSRIENGADARISNVIRVLNMLGIKKADLSLLYPGV